jgi:hypothetical protein
MNPVSANLSRPNSCSHVSCEVIGEGIDYTDTFAYWATAEIPIGPGRTMGLGGAVAIDTSQKETVTFPRQ